MTKQLPAEFFARKGRYVALKRFPGATLIQVPVAQDKQPEDTDGLQKLTKAIQDRLPSNIKLVEVCPQYFIVMVDKAEMEKFGAGV